MSLSCCQEKENFWKQTSWFCQKPRLNRLVTRKERLSQRSEKQEILRSLLILMWKKRKVIWVMQRRLTVKIVKTKCLIYGRQKVWIHTSSNTHWYYTTIPQGEVNNYNDGGNIPGRMCHGINLAVPTLSGGGGRGERGKLLFSKMYFLKIKYLFLLIVLKIFWGFVICILIRSCCKFSPQNIFLPTSEHQQAKLDSVCFLGICWYNCSIYGYK